MFSGLRRRNLILLYHRVAELERDPWSLAVTPAHFEEHLQVLQRYRRRRLEDMVPDGRWFGGLSVAITFDDGYADNYHAAAPLLEQYATPATFFIATGFIGESREYWWDELERVAGGDTYGELYQELQPLGHGPRRERLDCMLRQAGLPPRGRVQNLPMTGLELRALASKGLFEIGAHTVTHPLLAAQPPEVQAGEIRGSRDWLEAILERPVRSFSYPYGGSQHYGPDTVDAAREAGFERAYTTAARPVSNRDKLYELPRIVVEDMDGDTFEKMLFMSS